MTIHLPKDVEQSIEAAVHSGHFTSVDDALAQAARLLLKQIASSGPETKLSTGAVAGRKPVWERIQERTASVPGEEWDKVPADLAEQHDHYIYGTPKRPSE
jgi:Arc/MetJ-type ribon-helix-helix transcriptional regulator